MSETNPPAANDGANEPGERPTVGIGEAARMLDLTVAQVRRLCKTWERNPGEGLEFTWSAAWAPRTDINGHTLRGHRLPYRDAVEALVAAKRGTGQDSSS